jgi:uncharacterized protein YggE
MNELQIHTPDRIIVEESHYEYVNAISSKLTTTIKGTSFFNASVAFKKAKELTILVESLKAVGLDEKDFKLLKINAEVASGVFTRFSSVNYRIQIHCRDLEKLPEVLSAVASAKNVILEGIEWQYDEDQEAKNNWLQQALEKATARAKIMAASLGVTIAGVHECLSVYWNEQRQAPQEFYPQGTRLKAMSMCRVDENYTMQSPGFQLTGSERRGVQVYVAFKLS